MPTTRFNISLDGQVTRDNVSGKDKNFVYHVDLGADILGDMTEEQIKDEARKSLKITLQGDMRRAGITRDKAIAYLEKKFPEVCVYDYSFAESTASTKVEDKLRAIIATALGINPEDVTDAQVEAAKKAVKK